ncbi:hypothetical protein SAMN02744102_00816 [Paenibacillus barengoltzii]|nr:hypothetical protein SAMN02744102_00816 [Paenibacillus barengoltzii]
MTLFQGSHRELQLSKPNKAREVRYTGKYPGSVRIRSLRSRYVLRQAVTAIATAANSLRGPSLSPSLSPSLGPMLALPRSRASPYSSSAKPSKAIPASTSTMTAYCIRLSRSLRNRRDKITEKTLYEAISGAATMALLAMAKT